MLFLVSIYNTSVLLYIFVLQYLLTHGVDVDHVGDQNDRHDPVDKYHVSVMMV